MRRTWLLFVVCLTGVALAGPARAQQPPAAQPPKPAETQEEKPPAKDPNPVVLRLGNEEMRASEVEAIIETLPAQARSYYRTIGRRQFADYLVTMRVLSAEGERRKLGDDPATRRALELSRQTILAEAARREIESSVEVTPADVERYYKEHDKEFEQVHVRHIRIRATSSVGLDPEPSRPTPIPTDEEAEKRLEDLRKHIVAGEDFAEVARQNSDDLQTAGLGGDAGWISRGEQIPLDYAFALETGQLSPVFRGPYGFELVKLEARRIPPLDQLRSRIEKMVRRQKTEDLIQKLRSTLNPVVDEEYFKPIVPGQRSDTVYWQFNMPEQPKR